MELKTDIWDELTDQEKAFIEKSREEHKNGKGIPHPDVIKELRERIGKIKPKS